MGSTQSGTLYLPVTNGVAKGPYLLGGGFTVKCTSNSQYYNWDMRGQKVPIAGNGAFIYLSMIAPIRRGWLDLIPFSLTVVGYWVLISVAAYRALWQLLRRPFHWEKTQHGLSRHLGARIAPVRGTLP